MTTKAKLTILRGDVRSPQTKCKRVIVPHCCNTKGIMGAGVALAISYKWPVVTHQYEINCKKYGRDSLGTVDFYEVEDFNFYAEPVTIKIANMIGQLGTISEDNPKPVKYSAIIKCMEQVMMTAINDSAEIHCPKFCSDLAGGNFEFILELIQEIWVDNGIDVFVYEFD